MSGEILHITDASFQTAVLDATLPTLVDFWAPWCGPCRSIAPMLEKVAGTLQGQVQIAKMNVDDNAETPAQFSVRGIPTLILFKNGQAVDTIVGAVSESQLLDFLKKNQ